MVIQGHTQLDFGRTAINPSEHISTIIKEEAPVELRSSLNSISEVGFSELETSQLNISDSLFLTNYSEYNVGNSFANVTDFSSNITIDKLDNYSISDIQLQISSLKADAEKFDLESDIINASNFKTRYDSDYCSLSSTFTIYQDFVNITKLNIYYQAIGTPTGEIYLTGITDGEPNNTIIGEVFGLVSASNDWVMYEYSLPVTLKRGTYAVVVVDNSPSEDSDYYKLSYADDTVNGNQSKFFAHTFTNTTWVVIDGDLLFQYEALEVNNTGDAIRYTDPQEVNMTINEQNILTFEDNISISNTNNLFITSNTSITFVMGLYLSMISENNPINSILSWTANGQQLTYFELNFTIEAIPTLSNYDITRKLNCINLPNSWNATSIFNNNSLYVADIFNDELIQYSNGSNSLTININNEINASSWMITFICESIISNLEVLKNNDGLMYPYVISSNDTVDINIALKETLINSESIITIVDNNNAQIYLNNFSNFNISELSFEDIIIEDLIDQIDNFINPCFVSIEFFDNLTLNVGKVNFQLRIDIQTNLQIFENSLSISTISQLIGDNLQLETEYKNIHNNTILNGANVTYITSWGISGNFNQITSLANYFCSIDTSTASKGTETIIITASLVDYISLSKTITINFIAPTKVELTVTNSQFWTNSSTMIVQYNNQTSSDIIFYMTFKDDLNGEILTSSLLQTNETSESLEIASTQLSNGTWKITLSPLKISEQRLVFKYIEENYKTVTIILHLSIVEGNVGPITPVDSYFTLIDIILIVMGILIAISFSITAIYSINKRMKTIKEINSVLTKKLSFVKDTYLVLISNSAGIPLYHLINEKYSGKTVVEIVSGVSTSIDDFLTAFQKDFIKDFQNTQTQLMNSVDKEKINVAVSYINRLNFSITIVSSLNFRLFVFMEESSSKEVTRLLKQITRNLESKLKIKKEIIDNNIYHSQIESIVNETIPTILFKQYTMDIERLEKISHQKLLSKNAVLGLKKTIVNKAKYNASKSEIYKKFTKNTEITKSLKYIKQEYINTPLVFKYEECLEQLQDILKLSIKDTYEALWKSASPEIKVIVSYKELVKNKLEE